MFLNINIGTRSFVPKREMRRVKSFTAIDFETSGLSADRDRVIEIAAVRCTSGLVTSQFSTLVKFNDQLPAKVSQLTGLTQNDLKNGMDEETAFMMLDNFISDSLIVAHNATFDLAFLHFALHRLSGKPFTNNFIDTLTICRERHPYPHTLQKMCELYGIRVQETHRALLDVMSCCELLMRLQEESPVEEYINKLGYLRKYGPPKWFPSHATLLPMINKYESKSGNSPKLMVN